MSDADLTQAPPPRGTTAALVLDDGDVYWGFGAGAIGSTVGEVCFNTSMTGYQEILTDPSYAGQIITFTFPQPAGWSSVNRSPSRQTSGP